MNIPAKPPLGLEIALAFSLVQARHPEDLEVCLCLIYRLFSTTFHPLKYRSPC